MGRKELPTPLKYCENCGKKLERRILSSGYKEPLYWFNLRKYCSLKCANSAAGKARIKKKTVNAKTSRQRARKVYLFHLAAFAGKWVIQKYITKTRIH